MSTSKLSLAILPSLFAVCRLRNDENIPSWGLACSFCSVTRTPDELSIVCPQEHAPEGVEAVRGWRSLMVEGRLDFNQVGILSSLTSVLADAGISIFAISTYDTDYLFVRESDLSRSCSLTRGWASSDGGTLQTGAAFRIRGAALPQIGASFKKRGGSYEVLRSAEEA